MAYIGSAQNINGKVVDKYKFENNNIGVIVEDDYGKRCSIEFQASYSKPCLDNLYGLLDEPFRGKRESLDKLIKKGDYIGVNVNYSENPIRSAYRLNYVLNKPIQKVFKPNYDKREIFNIGYRPAFNCNL